jgi:predicted secreted Zn-dependent protease
MGRGTTKVFTRLDVDCVQVECGGWQRRIKLSVHFDVVYDRLSAHHEKGHIEIAENFLKKSAPYFGFLERVTYKTKEACEAAKHEAQQVLNLVMEAMFKAQEPHDWKDRLRDLF